MWCLNAQHLITYNLIKAKSPTPNLFSFCEYEYFDRMYICVPSECLVLCRGQKQVMDTFKLGLQMIMNHQVGARNWTRVHCESNESSTSLSPPNLFSNLLTFLNINLFTSSKHGNFSTTQLFTLSSSLGEKLKGENSEVNNLRDKIRVNSVFFDS